MKQKEPAKTFMMVSNWEKKIDLRGLYKNVLGSSYAG